MTSVNENQQSFRLNSRQRAQMVNFGCARTCTVQRETDFVVSTAFLVSGTKAMGGLLRYITPLARHVQEKNIQMTNWKSDNRLMRNRILAYFKDTEINTQRIEMHTPGPINEGIVL